jgi:uncharacterized repeat protein (TIGR03803 family)
MLRKLVSCPYLLWLTLCLLPGTVFGGIDASSSADVQPNHKSVPMSSAASSSGFAVLHAFAGPPKDGGDAFAPLIQDAAGNLYGTTNRGGALGAGTVFKVDAKGRETVLYSFTGETDGGHPNGAVARDASGNLYGTTYDGGDTSCSPPTGCGTVFKLNAAHVLTVLHNFESGSDAASPLGGVILDSSGNLYGIGNGGNSFGYGAVYKVNIRTRVETVLHQFAGGSDGEYPEFESLLLDASGNLYGTTQMGGSSNLGTVFKVSRSHQESVLHSFAGGTSDGCYPFGGVAMDASGNLFGTTQQCGSSGFGTVWKLNSAETVLYSFTGGDKGANTYAGVVPDASGNLYGVTYQGGATGFGTVFKLTAGGEQTVLHSFSRYKDGGLPGGGVLLGQHNRLYGTTKIGSRKSNGTLWSYGLK